ncbi:MAG TPA: hypothetical protein VL359_08040, partial [bacterium]|nr:hypothetical protein [bacterium]
MAAAGLCLLMAQAAAARPARVPGGPLPTQVRNVNVVLQGLNEDDTVDPGKPLGFLVQVTDQQGRVYSTAADARWPLDWSRLQVTAENMQVDAEHGRLLPEADLPKIAGRTYKLTVSYEGLANLKATYVLRPQIYAWYRDRMLESNRLVFTGDAGTPGEPGRHGGRGPDGASGGRQQKEREAAP